MNCRTLSLIIVFLGTSAFNGAFAQQATCLRVLSYNIHHAEGTDGQTELPRIAGIIRDARPDLVALQEVDRGVRRTGQADQPQLLSELTGMKVVYGDNISLEGGLYGNAVLTRLPIVRSKNHKLPIIDNGEQRGVLEVELRLSGGESLLLLATHLDHRPADEERLASVRGINELISDRGSTPALLVGDLNDLPESRVLATLGESWQRTNEHVLPTFPATGPQRQIDYVLFQPSNRWCVVETRVLDESLASDHRPVLAVLELRAP